MAQARELGKLDAEVLYRPIHHAFGIGQHKLGALVERALQRLVGLRPAMRHDHGFKINLQRGVSNERGIKPPPDQRFGQTIVFQQLVVQGQAKLLQGRHRGAAQQSGKPAVKSSDLNRAAAG